MELSLLAHKSSKYGFDIIAVSRHIKDFNVDLKELQKQFDKISDHEVLFDCGAYTGDSVLDFIKQTKGKYKKIISFEPDEKNFKKLESLVEKHGLQGVEIKKQATGSKNGKIGFVR